MIRYGLIGTGTAAGTHARELAAVPDARLVAVQARDPARATEFVARHAALHPGLRVCETLQDLVAAPDVDAVIITTPNAAHLEPALAAAAAGKHVVLEKPIEVTPERAQAIVDACAAAGVRLFLVYQRRHAEATERARADLAAGHYGDVVLVNIVDNEYRTPAYYADNSWRGRRASEGGGCVTTQSTHMLDLAQYLLGPITAVTALCRTRFHAIETEDTAAALLEFASGAIGTFSSSTAAYPGQRHLVTISGTRGSIVFNAEHDQITLRCTQDDAANDITALPDGFSFRDPVEPRDYPTHAHRRLLEGITAELLGGPVSPAATGDPMAALRVIEALYASAAQGCRVALG
ncbi:Gfo/Idh/MocA family protein [Pararhodobacter sp. CCB-MM2]|uniref:Gfo/Idh/MocA family protein n=1 Tax=Pararhodobacter sp. CCB-MM2 TaxID=1786003 RepID=UPI00083012F5|nr:Gfo/Idh/MocA family oxidoreductase [Pararhodobacter sp. CCB-MM2]